MSSHEPETNHVTHAGHAPVSGSKLFTKTLITLEQLDNIAHVAVAVFFVLMAVTVLIYTSALFVHQIQLMSPAFHAAAGEVAKAGEKEAGDPFFAKSLELLSHILFVVIVLELLKTIITYLQTRDIHAIMKEFLVVGIISSVRKILLVGAESSMGHVTGMEFIKEATGTVISIVGILILIVGLVMLQRWHPENLKAEGADGG